MKKNFVTNRFLAIKTLNVNIQPNESFYRSSSDKAYIFLQTPTFQIALML